MMFKAQVIQNLYGLGNEQLECRIEARRGFQRYPRLAWQSCAAHQKTISPLRTSRSGTEPDGIANINQPLAVHTAITTDNAVCINIAESSSAACT